MAVLPHTRENMLTLGKAKLVATGAYKHCNYYLYATERYYFFVVGTKLYYYPFWDTKYTTVLGHIKRAIAKG